MRQKSSGKFIFIFLIGLVILLLAGTSYYFYSKTQNLLKNPTAATQEETKTLLKQLSAIVELPQGETPQVATVLDKDKLKGQAFFSKAQNGDKVLIYAKAMKALLFRPSTNKIIDFSSISTNANAASTQTVTPLKVAVYNGTDRNGLSQTFEKDIKNKVTNVDVTVTDNAKKSDYAKTIVIDVAGSKADVTTQLATLIGGTVGKLPEGEVLPGETVDFLVILGKDYVSK